MFWNMGTGGLIVEKEMMIKHPACMWLVQNGSSVHAAVVIILSFHGW